MLEHVTTKEGAQYVAEAGPMHRGDDHRPSPALQPQRDLPGGIRPHYYCLPVLKREEHRRALVAAATSGSGRFFLGTDSAPHPAVLKEHASGCAGCYTAFSALELYAEAFEAAGALDRLERSRAAPGRPSTAWRRTDDGDAEEARLDLPEALPFGDAELKPLRGGETLAWRLAA